MRGVGDERALGGEQLVEPVGHRGDRVGQRAQLGWAARRSGRDGEVAVGESVGVGLQSSHRPRDGAGQPPSDERDEADDHDGDGGEPEPEPVDSGGDVARVDRDAQCAVHRSAGRDRYRDVEDVGCQRVGGSGARRRSGRSAPRRSRVGSRSRDRSGRRCRSARCRRGRRRPPGRRCVRRTRLPAWGRAAGRSRGRPRRGWR